MGRREQGIFVSAKFFYCIQCQIKKRKKKLLPQGSLLNEGDGGKIRKNEKIKE